MSLRKKIESLFVAKRWFLLVAIGVLLFVISFFFPILFEAAVVFTIVVMLFTILDGYLLFMRRGSVNAARIMPVRFSLADDNKVTLSISNTFPFTITAKMVEQLPRQFQKRDFQLKVDIKSAGRKTIDYTLRPLTRGAYDFGALLCYLQSPLGLLERRMEAAPEATVKVYPSFQQLKKYELVARSDNYLTGMKKVRRLGHSMEFEKIKAYVHGDDIRTINWKATARSANLMVNTYTDTREQQVYVLIDKGRSMKMPFGGMSLLDYAINATLSLLNVVLVKHDRAGLITFANKIGNVIASEKRSGQLQRIVEALYQQETEFKESDYETLTAIIQRRISQRSFLLLFTNFETLSSLDRQLPFLKQLSAKHLVCVVFFQNTQIEAMQQASAETIEDIYIKTIAGRFDYEKKLIVKELRRHGMLAILTTPQQLTVDVINKYLELKARQMV
ncbi:MAG TPA: DUF58 domain-containing protein [Flavipsychrobacter sp.]|nr:DUF58 domain-containing protein [Flavipsychrobacter sp.]